MPYNPDTPPDPDVWLQLPEAERLELVYNYLEEVGRGEHIESIEVLATLIATVENQVAFGAETPVAKHVNRLQMEGLDRYTAVLAVVDAFGSYMEEILQAGDDYSAEAYDRALSRIHAKDWQDTPPD